MQKSVHIRHDHGANDEWHRLYEGILPPSCSSPHNPKSTKQEPRKPHRLTIHIHRQKASHYSHPESLSQRNLIPDAPEYHHVDAKMKHIRMAEAIHQMIPPWAPIIESCVQKIPCYASHAKSNLSSHLHLSFSCPEYL